MGRFEDRTVLIVGAVRGIGAAHARGFHAEGAFVVIGDVHDEDGEKLASELGERALFFHMDPDDSQDWTTVMLVAEKHFGKVSMVINSAGLSNRTSDDLRS